MSRGDRRRSRLGRAYLYRLARALVLVAVAAAPVTLVAGLAMAIGWLTGWPPRRLYGAACWCLPMVAVWLAAAGAGLRGRSGVFGVSGAAGASGRAILLAVDEFSAVSRRLAIWQLYERARSLGLAVQVSAQSWEGLADREDERYRIAATAEGGIWLLRTPLGRRATLEGGQQPG
jgi:hypothetical protein